MEDRQSLSSLESDGAPGRAPWLKKALGHRYFPIVVALLAMAVTAPSLWGGWVIDDHHQRLRLLNVDALVQLPGSKLDLFRFADGDEETTRKLMDLGVWPWWTKPDLLAAFWRPISSLTHWLDYQLWPDNPMWMHAQSVLWFGGLVAAVALLFRRVMGATWVAGLAALLYAVDDARGMPVGFLSNRNAIIATLFGVMTILAHFRWRRDGRRTYAILAPLLLVVSLLSAEAGIGASAYLFAYAVSFETGPWRRRLATLVPYAVIIVAWRLTWVYLGYGIRGIGIYQDPLTEPLRYLVAVVQQGPVLLLAQFLFPSSDLFLLVHDLGWAWYYWAVAVIIMALLAMAFVPRLPRDATTRFWTIGALLAVLPTCAAFASDRMLFFVGLGAFGLIARFLSQVWHDKAMEPAKAVGKGPRVLAVAFVVVHLVIAPPVLAVRSLMPVGPRAYVERLQVQVPLGPEVKHQSVVVVTAPLPLFAGMLPERQALAGEPVPAHTRVLAPHYPEPTVVHRTDAHTLIIRPRMGYLGLATDRIARAAHLRFTVGQKVVLTGMTAEVLALTEDGRPAEVAFRFDKPLEDPSHLWLTWGGEGYVPFALPAIGETVECRTE